MYEGEALLSSSCPPPWLSQSLSPAPPSSYHGRTWPRLYLFRFFFLTRFYCLFEISLTSNNLISVTAFLYHWGSLAGASGPCGRVVLAAVLLTNTTTVTTLVATTKTTYYHRYYHNLWSSSRAGLQQGSPPSSLPGRRLEWQPPEYPDLRQDWWILLSLSWAAERMLATTWTLAEHLVQHLETCRYIWSNIWKL